MLATQSHTIAAGQGNTQSSAVSTHSRAPSPSSPDGSGVSMNMTNGIAPL
jgi:hypothetical protein